MKRRCEIFVSPLEGLTFDKYHVTVHPPDNAHPFAMFGELADCVKAERARIVAQFVFGGCELSADGMRELERVTGRTTWPVTWIQAVGPSGAELTGTQAYAVSGTPVRSVILDGRVLGSRFADEYAEYCILGDVLPKDLSVPREAQARSAFEQLEMALRAVGMEFSNVVRTWLYLAGLLDWYAEFNAVRSRFYEERGVFNGLLPASTGIGASNRHGSALVVDAMAVKPRDKRVTIRAVPSPLQCPATTYRSSFSRAVEMTVPGHRQLRVSGTASIDSDGKSVHRGDIRRQIERTMAVVEAILRSRGMDWSNTTRGIAYCKRVEDAPAFQRYCEEHRLASLPVALAHADICRQELLFEIEVDASARMPADEEHPIHIAQAPEVEDARPCR